MFADDTIIYSLSPTLEGVRSYLQIFTQRCQLINKLIGHE